MSSTFLGLLCVDKKATCRVKKGSINDCTFSEERSESRRHGGTDSKARQTFAKLIASWL